MRGARTLRIRLFLWLLAAIVIAIASSALLVGWSRPDPVSVGEIMARTLAKRLAETWDDPERTEAYLANVREVTGLDVHLQRGADGLPRSVQRAVTRGAAVAPDGPERAFIPVVRGGEIVGALRVDRFGVRPRLRAWWRLAAGLGAALVVLAIAANRVANLLAAPLERLAHAADRFGAGNFASRSELSGSSRRGASKRWVATEIEDLAAAFDAMAARVEAMVRGQRELLGAISHELRSPLGRARIALEIARDREAANAERLDPSSYRSPAGQLDEIEKQLGEVDAILGDLLAVTRAGLSDLRTQTITLGAFLRARIAAEPTPPLIELDESAAGGELRVSADAPLLGRAVHNLLSNARAHGHPPGEPLLVRVERRGGEARIVVEDRGPGFPADLLERAFEPFVRGDRARPRVHEGGDAEAAGGRSGGGTGLGLALVRRIAEAHGGSAFAENLIRADGTTAGARVGIVLPLTEAR